jgi:hypothetical protein
LAWAQDHGFFDGTSKAPEKQEPDLTTKKRRNYLTVIAALLKHHGYDLDKAPAESISMITAEYGRPIGTKTIRGYIKEIREEIEPDIDPR